jgi:hypothetical protein
MRNHVLRGSAAALTALAVLAGGATANPVAAIAQPAGTPATGAELHGHEQFRLITHSATSRRQRLRATGILDARGHALVGRVIAGRARNWLVVPHGAIRLITTVTAAPPPPPPSGTCRFTETRSGTYTIRGGAGRYASARGYGTYVTKIVGQLARKNGRCTAKIASFSQSTVTSGSFRW